jgi:membrane protein
VKGERITGRKLKLRIRIPWVIAEIWEMLKATMVSFINDEALSRGAAIAFYTVTSIAPVLLIVVAIAGLAFGHEAAQNSISWELGDPHGSASG